MNKPILTIVVPCFNEEEALKETSAQLSSVFNSQMFRVYNLLFKYIISMYINEKLQRLFVASGFFCKINFTFRHSSPIRDEWLYCV